jgi:integrase
VRSDVDGLPCRGQHQDRRTAAAVRGGAQGARRTTHTYLTAREVADLADFCGAQGDVVLILAYSGLRFGELTGLNVEDVDLGARRIRVRHDLRHTYASLSRRAGADLRLLQKAMGHASITVTAHTYADLFDDELDNIAAALDSLDDLSQTT